MLASLVHEHGSGGINDPVLELRFKALAWQRLLPIKDANEDQKVWGRVHCIGGMLNM